MNMKGSVLNEHRVAGTISVQALKRTIRLTAQEKAYELGANKPTFQY